MKTTSFKNIVLGGLKLLALGALVGALGGLAGAAFGHLLTFVTRLREASGWLILLLPVGAIATVLLYRLLRSQDFRGANEIVSCLQTGAPLRVAPAPLVFVSSALTHLLGGSAGREGAALQLGGCGAAGLSRALRLREEDSRVAILCGMSAVFAGLFGTPLTAAVFVLEFKLRPRDLLRAAVPCFLAAVIAAQIASALGVAPEVFHLEGTARFSFLTAGKILVLALGLGILGRIMCFAFSQGRRLAARLISNPLLLSAIAAALLIPMTAAVGDMRYNGSGMPLAITAVEEGTASWFDFLLKMAFTAVTLAAGLKGGQIVPTFCIGATFGCVFGGLLGLDAGFAAALGLVGLFCCVANAPVSGLFLAWELFGLGAFPWCALLCLVLWPLSASNGLFQGRTFHPVDRILKTQKAR